MLTSPVVATPSPEAEATLALANRFLEAINTRDADALVATVSEDALYVLRVAPHPEVRGPEGFRAALAALDATWGNYNFVTHAIYPDANQFVAEWTMTATLAQPLPVGTRTAVPDGRNVSFDGVDICTVVDGKVTAKISYVDATAWYEQLTFDGDQS